MNEKALSYLADNKICVLATQLPDGAPHAATVHYAHAENPLRLVVLTERGTRKCSGLLDGAPRSGSAVIGFDEGSKVTLQMDGSVRLLADEAEKAAAHAAYAAKFDREDKKKFLADPDAVFLEFAPSWWQFSDYRGEERERSSGAL